MKIHRMHYRAKLKEGYDTAEWADALQKCQEVVRSAQKKGQVLTAALYLADTPDISRTLFFYYEGVGEEAAVPEELLSPVSEYLQVCPGITDNRIWVKMYHIYYHAVPESVEAGNVRQNRNFGGDVLRSYMRRSCSVMYIITRQLWTKDFLREINISPLPFMRMCFSLILKSLRPW